ncbi:UNVERIFIED_CONTAM: hypothetical protein FKN15_019198 [Acipenser sinensis]
MEALEREREAGSLTEQLLLDLRVVTESAKAITQTYQQLPRNSATRGNGGRRACPAKPSFFTLQVYSEATRPIVPEDNTDLSGSTADPQAVAVWVTWGFYGGGAGLGANEDYKNDLWEEIWFFLLTQATWRLGGHVVWSSSSYEETMLQPFQTRNLTQDTLKSRIVKRSDQVKGITYDTGGADIKAGGFMAGMHRDKCGSAAVAGFFQCVTTDCVAIVLVCVNLRYSVRSGFSFSGCGRSGSSLSGCGRSGSPSLGDGSGSPSLGDGSGSPSLGDGSGSPSLGDGSGSPSLGDGSGSPSLGDGSGSPSLGDGSGSPSLGDGSGSPSLGDGSGSPSLGDGSGSPSLGDGSGSPSLGDGSGSPSLGDGSGSPSLGDGSGSPSLGDGSGSPSLGDGSGSPSLGDGSGSPSLGDGSGSPSLGDGSGSPSLGDGSGSPLALLGRTSSSGPPSRTRNTRGRGWPGPPVVAVVAAAYISSAAASPAFAAVCSSFPFFLFFFKKLTKLKK